MHLEFVNKKNGSISDHFKEKKSALKCMRHCIDYIKCIFYLYTDTLMNAGQICSKGGDLLDTRVGYSRSDINRLLMRVE